MTVFALVAEVGMFVPPAGADPNRDSAPLVSYDGGRLTVQAADVQLAALMKAIGDVAGISVRISPDLNRVVSADFKGVPLEQALRRVLQNSVWVMIHGPQRSDGGGFELREIWIYGLAGKSRPPVRIMAEKSSRESNAIVHNDPDAPAVAQEVAELNDAGVPERLLAVDRLARLDGPSAIAALGRILDKDAHPDVRLRALNALRRRNGEGVVNAIEHGLGDENPTIRVLVLDALVDTAGEAAVPAIGQVLFGDGDPDVRLEAVHYLAEVPGEASRALLEAAAKDIDSMVRAAAAHALETR